MLSVIRFSFFRPTCIGYVDDRPFLDTSVYVLLSLHSTFVPCQIQSSPFPIRMLLATYNDFIPFTCILIHSMLGYVRWSLFPFFLSTPQRRIYTDNMDMRLLVLFV